MAEPIDNVERRISTLRAAVRRAVMARDDVQATALRAELRAAERDWEQALGVLTKQADGQLASVESPLVSLRDQVHHALTLLSAPAAPKLIAEVHNAFLGVAGTAFATGKLTHLRRDEERSFRTARHSRPYYLCSTLTAEHLTPARGLLAVSTWPLERRIVGPLSPRVDFLNAAIQVAEQATRLPEQTLPVARLLWRFAANIPGAAGGHETTDPAIVIKAARAELEIHADADRTQRAEAAERARVQLDEAEQLFGNRLRVLKGSA
ncbi:hypothetical protein O3597_20165 [Verrucosispora sp. WMMA2044]|uniref:hypothetical protein n=1 Tax=Verrucosispora sp. WMMA2044 TaxID=3016419 RepID=UPI00248B2FF3|nr:hypothetical protein [Verrucosispora sp. WMMA2044]WBB47443.1 hypothetical protein O3597_20165 [Verrucosispora sp. WMMA2044]